MFIKQLNVEHKNKCHVIENTCTKINLLTSLVNSVCSYIAGKPNLNSEMFQNVPKVADFYTYIRPRLSGHTCAWFHFNNVHICGSSAHAYHDVLWGKRRTRTPRERESSSSLVCGGHARPTHRSYVWALWYVICRNDLLPNFVPPKTGHIPDGICRWPKAEREYTHHKCIRRSTILQSRHLCMDTLTWISENRKCYVKYCF